MRISLVLRAFVMAIALVGWMAAPALAAPTVLSTDPAAGAEMHDPPAEVTVEFSEPLQSTSGMEVTDECGTEVGEGKARVVGTAMNELNVVIGKAPHHGTYTVEYVATGVTGTTTGSFEFIVHGGTDCDGGGGGGHHGGGGGGGGSGSGGHNGGGHSGMGHGSGSSGDGTGSTDHSGMDMSHDKSGGMNHKDMKGMNHKNMNHKDMKGMNHGNGKNSGGEQPPQAGGEIAVAIDIPTGSTVVVALSLAILMGLVGGWVLRVSSPS